MSCATNLSFTTITSDVQKFLSLFPIGSVVKLECDVKKFNITGILYIIAQFGYLYRHTEKAYHQP